MARPAIHCFPPLEMLSSIAAATLTLRGALNAKLEAALDEQERERQRREADNAARVAAGASYAEWGQLHPSPPSSNDAWYQEREAREGLKQLDEFGIPYDLPAFTGRDLTPSARIAAQKCVRELEARRLVVLLGVKARWVKLTEPGLAAVEGSNG